FLCSSPLYCVFLSFLHTPRVLRDLHSFPTRRSSDLSIAFGFGSVRKELCRDIPIVGVHVVQDRTSKRFLDGEATHFRPRRIKEGDRKSTRLNSSHEWISYAVFCLKKKNK